MSTISLRLPSNLLKKADRHAKELKVSRAEYVRVALEAMNTGLDAEHRGRRIAEASRRVRGESVAVNAEFAKAEHDTGD